MAGDKFYKSAAWRELRKQALWRDGGICVVEGCWEKAVVVDHRKARPRGAEGLTAEDVLPNLRSLCRMHDNQVKENANGVRKQGGQFLVRGYDEQGFPKDPNHPWNKE